jgi:hypothetical protein
MAGLLNRFSLAADENLRGNYERSGLMASLPVCERCAHRAVGRGSRGGRWVARIAMCRNIKTLHNFRPPATEEEIRASSLQFVRKLSGFTRPSKANQLAFDRAVDEVAKAAHQLLASLVTNAPPRDREVEASKAQARAANRFG